MRTHRTILAMAGLALLATACRADMQDAPMYEEYEVAALFHNGQVQQLPIEGTVARGQLREDEHLYTGKVNGQLAESFPFAITKADLERGRERYDIYCSPCHDYTGGGNGMIVQRGFLKPPEIYSQKVASQPVGYYFDVITNGFGNMLNYRARVKPEDRWRIAAYLRVLQKARNVSFFDLPAADQKTLREVKE